VIFVISIAVRDLGLNVSGGTETSRENKIRYFQVRPSPPEVIKLFVNEFENTMDLLIEHGFELVPFQVYQS